MVALHLETLQVSCFLQGMSFASSLTNAGQNHANNTGADGGRRLADVVAEVTTRQAPSRGPGAADSCCSALLEHLQLHAVTPQRSFEMFSGRLQLPGKLF